MRLEPVDSSVIASVGYDRSLAVLEVEFTNGSRYRYYAVPASVHRALVSADSVGRAFARLVRDRYPTERIE